MRYVMKKKLFAIGDDFYIKDEDGILQLLIGDPASDTDELVVTAIGEFGHADG